MLDLKEDAQGVSFSVRVSPRASRSAVTGLHDSALKVSLAAPPVDGEANAELCALLAKCLHVPKRAVSVLQGERGKSKVVRVLGVTRQAVLALVKEDAP
ncbi:MAG TPA: DUF167 domain-containing protein [Polyangiales bacterium]